MLSGELVVIVMLLLPAPEKHLNWTVNEIPTQVQLIFEEDIQVSYAGKKVSCETKPEVFELLLVPDSEYMADCYMADVTKPLFVRHPYYWMRVKDIHDHKQDPFQGKPIRGWERFP